jgi:hypothetical protein
MYKMAKQIVKTIEQIKAKAEYDKLYRLNNKDKIREKNKRYMDSNREKILLKRRQFYYSLSKEERNRRYKIYAKKYRSRNPEKIKIWSKRNYLAHTEKIIQSAKEYYKKNRDKKLQYSKKYRKENIDKVRAYYRRRSNNLYQKDINFNLRSRISSRVNIAARLYFKNGKKIKPKAEYGIDLDAIIKHLSPAPSPLNIYHIDHIRPLCSFDLTKEEQIKEAFAPENHQWLLIRENESKASRDKLLSIRGNKHE